MNVEHSSFSQIIVQSIALYLSHFSFSVFAGHRPGCFVLVWVFVCLCVTSNMKDFNRQQVAATPVQKCSHHTIHEILPVPKAHQSTHKLK